MAVYTVKSGDTLSDLARRFGTTVDAIAKENNIKNPDLIHVNQQLNIGGGSSGGSSSSAAPAPAPVDPMEKYTYKPSDTVTKARALLDQLKAQKPGEFTGTWGDQIAGKVQEILNGKDFTYDVNKDALYQQLREQYSTMGKMAMMDTMGQAAALTGGYGNSWAQSAGQQAYQQYLQQLTQQVPELYGMALDKHNQDRQALYDQLSMMTGMDEQEYGRYMDGLNRYFTELGLARDEVWRLEDQEYNRWLQNRQMEYQIGRDAVADEQWQKQYDEGVRQFNAQMASKGSSGGGGGKKTASYTSVYNGMLSVAKFYGMTDARNYLEEAKEYLNEDDYKKLKEILDGIEEQNKNEFEGY